jgi:AcrR family transcriptional regulator
MSKQERTFTETARRAQIVRAAIETIAELGYGRASFGQIAKRAGLSSTGLISYHFAGKDELMGEVVTEVMGTFTAFVLPRMQAQRTKAGELRAFVESNVDFMRTHRTQLAACWTSWRVPAATTAAHCMGPGWPKPMWRS